MKLTCVPLLFGLACAPAPPAPRLDLPDRPADAPGGDEIASAVHELDVEEREERIYAEVAQGNVPTWLRQLEPVEITSEVDGRTHDVTFWAMPDYLAVGSDDDFFYVPLSPRMAQRIADLVGASLPTPRMVDAVWSAARIRLVPIRIRPDEDMWTVGYFQRHSRLVQAQARLYRARPGDLLAGHKLDVVVAATPAERAGDVAIYGWHRTNGEPIQPIYYIPPDSRPTFSMGIRLVHRAIVVDGAGADLLDVLRDPGRAPSI